MPALGWKLGLVSLALDPLTVCLALWPIAAGGGLRCDVFAAVASSA